MKAIERKTNDFKKVGLLVFPFSIAFITIII